MKRRLFLPVLSLALAALFLYGCVAKPEAPSFEKISAEEAHTMMAESNDFILVDVRTDAEYNEAHIEGALLFPNESIDEAAAAQALPDKDARIIVYCRSGRRSAEAAGKLAALGYTGVYDMGGIIDWTYGTVH